MSRSYTHKMYFHILLMHCLVNYYNVRVTKSMFDPKRNYYIIVKGNIY